MVVKKIVKVRFGCFWGCFRFEDVVDIEDKLLLVVLKEFQEQGYGVVLVINIVKIVGMFKIMLYF